MGKIFTTVACALFLYGFCSNASFAGQRESAAQSAVVSKHETWAWPLENQHASSISQDYAEYDACLDANKGCDTPGAGNSHKYHTGLDIAAPRGTDVEAVADGYVVFAIPNDPDSNCNNDGGCTDHGDGNTLIIAHGNGHYSQYQHMLNFDPNDNDTGKLIKQIQDTCSAYDETHDDVRIVGWKCSKTDNVTVTQGEKIGHVGATGYGTDGKYYGNHLHLEGKLFDTLYSPKCIHNDNCCPQGACFGYTAEHPSKFGYLDPVNFIEGASRLNSPLHVKLSDQGDGVSLRLGPDQSYDVQTKWHIADGEYWAQKMEPNITTNCDMGWYKVRKTEHTEIVPDKNDMFAPTDASRAGPGYLPDTWVCIGNNGTTYVEVAP